MKVRPFVLTLILSMSPASSWLFAQPALINYQGRLVDGTNLVNGTVDLRLRLFPTAISPTLLYEDQGLVSVADGLYATAMGDGTTAGTLASAITNSELWLEVVVDGTTLTPRERVASVAYALMAGGVASGAITSAMLADGSVTSNKLAPGAVQPGNLAKTYQSGRIPITTYFFAASAVITQTFPTAFAATPNVTLGLESSFDDMLEECSLGLRSVSPTGFAVRLGMPDARGGVVAQDSGNLTVRWGHDLEHINGLPAFGYIVRNEIGFFQSLYYVRASVTNGTAWQTAIGVDTNGGQVVAVGLALVNTRPALGYYDEDAATLRYIRAADSLGDSWGVPSNIVSGVTNANMRLTLMLVNGRPSFCYDARSGFGLSNGVFFLRANDINGNSWPAPILVTQGSNVDAPAMALILGGFPAIAYSDFNAIRFSASSNINGSVWAAPVTVTTNNLPYFNNVALGLVNGNPAITYFNSNSDVMFVRANNSTGTSWGVPVQAADLPASSGGNSLAIAIVGGAPFILFSNNDGVAGVVRALDANGTAWGPPQFVTGVRKNTRLGLSGGRVSMGYRNQTQILYEEDNVSPAWINWTAVEP